MLPLQALPNAKWTLTPIWITIIGRCVELYREFSHMEKFKTLVLMKLLLSLAILFASEFTTQIWVVSTIS